VVQAAVFQLVEQGLLLRTAGDRPVLELTPSGRELLAGRREVRLRLPETAARRSAAENAGWEGVDRGLFEHLRELRRAIADERGVPPFVVFGDATLRELARLHPSTPAAFGSVRGVGERKLADLGERFVGAITAYCREHRLPLDVRPVANEGQRPLATAKQRPAGGAISLQKRQAFALFDQGATVDEVVAATGRVRSTVGSYLEEYVAERKPASVAAWVDDDIYERVVTAARRQAGSFLKPVFEALNGEVSYDDIRVVMRHAGLR
jgi:ATP-dependent DNA helicase RecQ